jgi:hypothetical protein
MSPAKGYLLYIFYPEGRLGYLLSPDNHNRKAKDRLSNSPVFRAILRYFI